MIFRQKGFTLIELLVVIAIIGILSSVVLASLNSARQKGANAAVKSNLSSIRAQAEIFYDTTGNGSYGAFGTAFVNNNCITTSASLFADTKIRSAIQAAKNATGNGTAICISQPNTNSTYYVISVAMNPETVGGVTYNWWCIDSNGASKGHTNAISSTVSACP